MAFGPVHFMFYIEYARVREPLFLPLVVFLAGTEKKLQVVL